MNQWLCHLVWQEAQALHGRRSCRQTIIHRSTEDSSAHLNSQTEDKLAGQLVICSSFSRYHIIHLDTSSGHWAENCRVPETPLISYLQAPDVMSEMSAQLCYLNLVLLHRVQAVLGQKLGLPYKKYYFGSFQLWLQAEGTILVQDFHLPRYAQQLKSCLNYSRL